MTVSFVKIDEIVGQPEKGELRRRKQKEENRVEEKNKEEESLFKKEGEKDNMESKTLLRKPSGESLLKANLDKLDYIAEEKCSENAGSRGEYQSLHDTPAEELLFEQSICGT